MSAVSVLPTFVAFVADYLGADVEVRFGRRYLAQQNQDSKAGRVVFAPDPEGRAGKIIDARLEGTNGTQRPIKTWEKYLVVQVWALDDADAEDELLQWSAFEDLLERVFQAVAIAPGGKADATWGDPVWKEPTTERFSGYAAHVPLTLRGPLLTPAALIVKPQPGVHRDPAS